MRLVCPARFGFAIICYSILAIAFLRGIPNAAANSNPNNSSTVVVIDAGHGGHDRGGIPGQRVAEKTMTLDVAKRLQGILNSSGYRTIMTRDSDVFIPLPTRVAIANEYRNAIFVCIHFNSARRSGANGIETYFYSSQSLPLASAIHYYVSRAAPSSNRGVRRRGYYVLRRTAVPAVLVECGFLTNPTEAQYAQSVNYRQMLAQQIARGIQSRSLVTKRTGSAVASTDAVPLQPYIDQTHVRDPDISGHRHRKHKISRSKKTAAVHRKKRVTRAED
jgi:N-acetylmuramoyl-L-alanine amidase